MKALYTFARSLGWTPAEARAIVGIARRFGRLAALEAMDRQAERLTERGK